MSTVAIPPAITSAPTTAARTVATKDSFVAMFSSTAVSAPSAGTSTARPGHPLTTALASPDSDACSFTAAARARHTAANDANRAGEAETVVIA